MASRTRSEEHTSELQSHRDLHSFPTRRSSDLVEPCVAPVERAAVAVLLDQPFGVVAGRKGADGASDLVDGLEDAAVDGLLFQRAEEALDDAVIWHVGGGALMSCRSASGLGYGETIRDMGHREHASAGRPPEET